MIPSTMVSQANNSPFPFLPLLVDDTSDDVSLELLPVIVESSETNENNIDNQLAMYSLLTIMMEN